VVWALLSLMSQAGAQPLWSVGPAVGVGARVLPSRERVRGLTPAVDVMAVEVRRGLDGPLWAPARLDVQVDGFHGLTSAAGTRRARVPVTAYGTWLRPLTERRTLSLSGGLYTELGRDALIRDEQLAYGPGGALALAGRVGLEKQRVWWDATGIGTYVRVDAGVLLGSDPRHAHAKRLVRFGVERSWTWGWGSVGWR
jgi:hypothetical protein